MLGNAVRISYLHLSVGLVGKEVKKFGDRRNFETNMSAPPWLLYWNPFCSALQPKLFLEHHMDFSLKHLC